MSRPEEHDIRARQAIHEGAALRTQGVRDIDWLLGRVERLQGLLARLEWAGQSIPGARIGTRPRCPVCRVTRLPHDRGCWLAAELQ